MVPIKTAPCNRANYGGKRTGKPEWIVMHYTANDGDSDESNGRYFQQALNPVASAHYFVDDDSITSSVPEDCVAYHCGANSYRHPSCRNYNSIGIELCDAKRDGKVMATDKTLQNAAELVAKLMEKYGIAADHIIRHYDVTGKKCPAYWVDNPAGFAAFKKLVQEVGEMVEKSTMIVDGKTVQVERILKGGVNYVKVRDIAAALGLQVSNKGSVAVLDKPANK